MATNLIINGDFSSGSANWTGTDIEAGNSEHVYLNNGETGNAVAEVNGGNGAYTVMEQDFIIDNPLETELTFDAALRVTGKGTTAGEDGFTVEILDSSGNVIAFQTILPTTNTLDGFSLDVDFDTAGTYTLRLTEVGTNENGSGAIVDNISLLVCFTQGTDIDTPLGLRKIEDLAVNDLVTTANGPQSIRWIGRRTVSSLQQKLNAKLRPVTISAGALGGNLPHQDLKVSRQHRMIAQSPIAKRMFQSEEILLAAVKLTALPGIYVDDTLEEVTYFHILFDEHEIVYANGAPSESLFTGPEALQAVSPEAREELQTLFPQLFDDERFPYSAAYIPEPRRQRRFVERLSRAQRHILDQKPMLSARRT